MIITVLWPSFILRHNTHEHSRGGSRPVKRSSVALDGWSSDINKANMKLCLKDAKVSSKHDFKHDFFTSPLQHQITN